jgi:predicted GTPase
MATSTRCERLDFLAALAQLRSEFNAAKVDIKTREERLENALRELVGSVKDAAGNSGLKENNQLAQAVDNTNKKITASLENWRTDVNRYQRDTEFRENFGDSLLVYVYGKVKAGKSSIGNYVAYGHGDPHRSIIDAAEPTPEFFCEAIAEDAEQPEAKLTAAALEEKRKLAAQRKLDAQRSLAEQRKFTVGACETTASIQGFKLSGLTWIDSPGLHSKTKPNGGLAQEYVAAADLVLYPMSSSQPGRATDLEEIADLLHKGKRVEVVITRCDVTEEDVDNGEIVQTLKMKPDKDRTVQSEYVYKEIVQLGQKQRDDQLEVLTVSVRYAEEHADDIAQIEKSGMNALFRKLTALTQSEGVRLKKETPLNNLRAFVTQIRTGDLSVKKLRSDLEPLEKNIAEQRRQLKQKQTIVIGRVLTELNPLIEDAVRKENTRRDIKALEKTCTEHLQRIISTHVDKALSDIFNETQSAVDNAVRFQELNKLPEFRDKFKEVSAKKETGGIFGLSLGALAGGVAGFLLGGPAGLVLGASLGSGIGSTAEAALAGTKIESVPVGNNMLDVLNETMKIFDAAAHKTVETAFTEMDNNFLKPIEQQAQTVNAALDRFVNILEKEVYPPQ